jgi:hypothetical protein
MTEEIALPHLKNEMRDTRQSANPQIWQQFYKSVNSTRGFWNKR